MSSCSCKNETRPPVFAIDVIDSCDGRPKNYKQVPCPKEDDINMICTEPIPMKIVATKTCGEDKGPIGLITRNQDFDIIGGKYVYTCLCGMRNGLQADCKRLSCQNNPGCNMNPPRCWPKYKPKPVQRREINGPIRVCFFMDKNSSN